MAVPVAPFEGQVCHCPILVDFKDNKGQSAPVREYVAAVFHGGMNSKAFNGISRGQTIKKDGSGKKIHDFYEMYVDPALAASHGSQEVSGEVIGIQQIFGESFSIPLRPITELPATLPGGALLVYPQERTVEIRRWLVPALLGQTQWSLYLLQTEQTSL